MQFHFFQRIASFCCFLLVAGKMISKFAVAIFNWAEQNSVRKQDEDVLSFAVLAGGGTQMKISARNQLKGIVRRVEHGAVDSEVTIELPGNIEVVSVITKHSAEQLQIAAGREVYAVIKATDVIIGSD